MKTSLRLSVAVLVVLVAGCDSISQTLNGHSSNSGATSGTNQKGNGGQAGANSAGGSGGQGGTSSVGGTSGAGGASGVAGSSGASGLPCDVQTVFVNRCASCHGSTPTAGAPRALVTYANLTMADPANPSLTEAQVSLQRAQNSVAPMPPAPAAPLTSSEIATIQTWISNGYPKGTCGVSTGGSSGAGGAGGKGGASGAGGSSSGDAGAATGLPCNIQNLVNTYCGSCHGTSLAGGAPRALVTYANLTMADPANTSLTEAQVSLQRMQSTVAPMPPSPSAPVPASAIAEFQTWINSGYPTGSCSTGGTGGTGAGGSSGAGGSKGSDAGVPGGSLPCDVQTLLMNRCDSCHGSTPAGGAPRALVTYANLTMADPANPSLTEAQASLARMQSTTSPMPPSPASPPTSAEIATLQNWINAGYPSGSCSGDAGVVTPDPLNAAPTCTSKVNWTGGNNGSSAMNPGQACISCHNGTGGEAPRYVIAGTLYPTGHEPNNCDGVNGSTSGAKVVITGSNGTTITLTPNSAGNFYSSTTLPGPYKAKVVNSAGKERVMVSTASSGDCNTCHTQNGANGAPGRVTMP